jgi:hypothetical protein
MDPNGFSTGFARGLELRQLDDEIFEWHRGRDMARGYDMAAEVRRVQEEERTIDRAREAHWARLREETRENLRSPIDDMIVAGDQALWEWCQNRPQPAMVDKREEAVRKWCQIQAEILQKESLVERDRMRDRQFELRRLIDGRSLTAGKTR